MIKHKDDIYIDVFDLLDPLYPFSFIIDGRGVGKTYSALRGVVELQEGFILLRRTEEERRLATVLNPFAALNNDYGWDICTAKITKDITGFYHGTLNSDGLLVPSGAPIGYLLALSVLHKVRGLGISTDFIKWIVYDEFIPEPHVREIQEEAFAFFNAYETLCRNRELSGFEPIKVIALANSNRLNNPIFRELKLIRPLEVMLRTGKTNVLRDVDRGIAVHYLKPSEAFLQKKSVSAIAKLTAGTKYSDMALKNEFALEDFSSISRVNTSGYSPFFSVGAACVWRKKGESHQLFCSYQQGSFAYRYAPANKADKMLAQSRHGLYMRKAYANGWIKFESFELKELFLDFFAIK